MFAELDKIALTVAIPMESIFDVPPESALLDSENGGGLQPGDVGIVVDVQGGGAWLCVEFLEASGYTVALANMPASSARPATERDIASARFLDKTKYGWRDWNDPQYRRLTVEESDSVTA